MRSLEQSNYLMDNLNTQKVLYAARSGSISVKPWQVDFPVDWEVGLYKQQTRKNLEKKSMKDFLRKGEIGDQFQRQIRFKVYALMKVTQKRNLGGLFCLR